MNRIFFIVFFFTFAAPAFSEKCELEYLGELEYTDVECQFYLGTAAYRNEVYSVAAAHWNYVMDSPSKYEGDDSIKAMALSTITFLYYQGLGVKEDKGKAVKNWQSAVEQGDFEARRHLGFAYSDTTYKKYDLVKALGWYESVFLVVDNVDALDESDLSVYKDAQKAAETLRSKLSDKQKSKALSFARSTL
jgi:hypothetical protein